MATNYCPACGRAGVRVGLNSVLIETAPAVRFHACGVGGSGSSSPAPPEMSDRERRYHESNQWGR